jgi:hypothetical protein
MDMHDISQEANQILTSWRNALKTEAQREQFDWASDATRDHILADWEDIEEEIQKEGLTPWLLSDLEFRLTDMLQDMVDDQFEGFLPQGYPPEAYIEHEKHLKKCKADGRAAIAAYKIIAAQSQGATHEE